MTEQAKRRTKKIINITVGLAVGACAGVAVDILIKKLCPGLDEGLTGPKKVMANIGMKAISAAFVAGVSSTISNQADEITDSVIQTIEKAQETIAEVKNLEEAE